MFVLFDITIQLIKRGLLLSRYVVHLFFIILLFYLWILISATYSPSVHYKYEKLISFLPNIVFFIYPIFIRKINFDLIIKYYLIVLIPLSLTLIFLRSITWSGFIQNPDSFAGNAFDYLSLGLHLGILFLLLNHFNKSKWIQIITFLTLFASSARGPFLFTVILILIKNYKYFFKIKFVKNIFKLQTIVGFSLLSLFFSTQLLRLFTNSYLRFVSLFSTNDVSSGLRFNMFTYSLKQPFESFSTVIFGNGIGSFGYLFAGIDQRAYPHNMILEIFFELGIIGLFFGFLIFLYVLMKFNLRKNIFSLLLLFIFFNSMKSSNLTDSWILFSCIGASCMPYSNHRAFIA